MKPYLTACVAIRSRVPRVSEASASGQMSVYKTTFVTRERYGEVVGSSKSMCSCCVSSSLM
jgi:hypothetical protein